MNKDKLIIVTTPYGRDNGRPHVSVVPLKEFKKELGEALQSCAALEEEDIVKMPLPEQWEQFQMNNGDGCDLVEFYISSGNGEATHLDRDYDVNGL